MSLQEKEEARASSLGHVRTQPEGSYLQVRREALVKNQIYRLLGYGQPPKL